jgi:HK97 family phage major capsid protein
LDNLTEVNLDTYRSVEELANFDKELSGRMSEIHSEFGGLPLPDERRAEFAALQELRDGAKGTQARIKELNARESYIRSMGESANRTERVDDSFFRGAPRASVREQDIYDLSTIRSSLANPEGVNQELRDRAMKAIDIARFPVGTNRSAAQEHMTNLLDSVEEPSYLARRILTTGSPTYARAFGKAVMGAYLSGEEQRALSLTGAAGGFAVPITIDPTVIPISNSSVNPLREISTIVQITGDEWRGVTSGAVTVAYAAEATETTDNAPTIAQPTISTEKAQAFIPFSIEIGQDWSGMQASMARLLQEGKDDLEADKFFTGSGTNEPFGVITGATTTVTATTGQTFDAEDLYRLEAALPPRYRARARFTANRAIYNAIRQFVLTGQSNPWKDLEQATSTDGRVGNLLGYPAHEASGMTGTTATGVKFLVLGDFSRYVIVDRVGLDVEVIQHLVGTNHRPTGQRGLYAYFRNGAKVVDVNAFRVLLGVA